MRSLLEKNGFRPRLALDGQTMLASLILRPQELMNNSLRHGKATIITILFEKIDGVNICEYKDNGIGFDTNDSENQKGLGMKNVESRISFINGTMAITSSKNEGVSVVINF